VRRRGLVLCACLLVMAALVGSAAAPASADLGTLLSAESCSQEDALDGDTGVVTLPYKLCDDGKPGLGGGATANPTDSGTVAVPAARRTGTTTTPGSPRAATSSSTTRRAGSWTPTTGAAVVRRRGRKRLAVTSRRRGAGTALVTLKVSRAAKPGRHRLKVRISCAGARSQVVARRVRFVP